MIVTFFMNRAVAKYHIFLIKKRHSMPQTQKLSRKLSRKTSRKKRQKDKEQKADFYLVIKYAIFALVIFYIWVTVIKEY